MATPNVIPKKVQSFGTAVVKWSRSKPIHPVKGPGNMGMNAPIIPKQTKKKPINSKNISIRIFLTHFYMYVAYMTNVQKDCYEEFFYI